MDVAVSSELEEEGIESETADCVAEVSSDVGVTVGVTSDVDVGVGVEMSSEVKVTGETEEENSASEAADCVAEVSSGVVGIGIDVEVESGAGEVIGEADASEVAE